MFMGLLPMAWRRPVRAPAGMDEASGTPSDAAASADVPPMACMICGARYIMEQMLKSPIPSQRICFAFMS